MHAATAKTITLLLLKLLPQTVLTPVFPWSPKFAYLVVHT